MCVRLAAPARAISSAQRHVLFLLLLLLALVLLLLLGLKQHLRGLLMLVMLVLLLNHQLVVVAVKGVNLHRVWLVGSWADASRVQAVRRDWE